MGLKKRILEVIEKKGEATLSDLYAALPEYPRHSIRATLNRAVRKGVLRRASKGVYVLAESAAAGRAPSAAGDTVAEPAEVSEEAAPRKDTSSSASTDEADAAEDNVSTKQISEELRKRVLRLLRRQPDATPAEIASALNAPKDAVAKIFFELVEEGLLEAGADSLLGEERAGASLRNAGVMGSSGHGEDSPAYRERRSSPFSGSCEDSEDARTAVREPPEGVTPATPREHPHVQNIREVRVRGELRELILEELRRLRRASPGALLEAVSTRGWNEEEVRRQLLELLQEGVLWFTPEGSLRCGDTVAEDVRARPRSLQDVLRLRALKPWQVAAVMGYESLWELLLASEKYQRRLKEIARYYPEKKRLLIDFEDVATLSHDLADRLLERPDSEFPELIKAASSIASRHHISWEAVDEDTEKAGQLQVNVGIRDVPEKVEAREIGEPQHFGRLVTLEGIVSRAGFPFSKLRVGAFRCRYCDAVTMVPQPEDTQQLQRPRCCDDCGKQALILDQEESEYDRVQVLHVIDDVAEVSDALPGVAEVLLKDDLPRIIPPGSRVRVCGIVRGTTSKKNRSRRQYLEALWLERLDSDPSQELTQDDLRQIKKLAADPRIVERLTKSIAPHIYGMEHIKEAILYQLFSSPRVEEGGRWIRGEIHILVVGEPSVGKSDTARWVHQNRLLPRSVYVDCENATGAGLTIAAVKDESTGAWSVEAGAAVLADQGLLVLDEFDKLSKEHRRALHTLMEAGVVDVAKAGVKGTFPARCSVLACANPKYGRFDEYRPLSEQINLPPTILSRFDLIFLVRDDLSITREVARHVLGEEGQERQEGDVIPPELLRKYIAYARKNVNPVLSEEAKRIIEEFYVEARERAMSAEDMPIPLTVRQLRAAVRLTKARARTRLSNIATAEDARAAIELIKTSLSQVGLDLETGRFDIDKIYVGVTKSQRDKIKEILGIIRELEDQYGTARKEEILQLAERRGISKEYTLECIEKLRQQGDLFEPKYDHFKTT